VTGKPSRIHPTRPQSEVLVPPRPRPCLATAVSATPSRLFKVQLVPLSLQRHFLHGPPAHPLAPGTELSFGEAYTVRVGFSVRRRWLHGIGRYVSYVPLLRSLPAPAMSMAHRRSHPTPGEGSGESWRRHGLHRVDGNRSSPYHVPRGRRYCWTRRSRGHGGSCLACRPAVLLGLLGCREEVWRQGVALACGLLRHERYWLSTSDRIGPMFGVPPTMRVIGGSSRSLGIPTRRLGL
jgi:hypothetical protein